MNDEGLSLCGTTALCSSSSSLHHFGDRIKMWKAPDASHTVQREDRYHHLRHHFDKERYCSGGLTAQKNPELMVSEG
jgi:hypothetical protein